nr:DUF4350 domain-containing protein [Schlegelella koreensis]
MVLAAWWLGSNLERVNVEREVPPSGEATRDPHYAAKALLRRLGARVSSAENLAQLPPSRATLLLTSVSWNLFPGRAEQLQRWVADGGHLVLPEGIAMQDSALHAWVPLREVRDPPSRPPAGAASRAPASPSPRGAAPGAPPLDEPDAETDIDGEDDADAEDAPARSRRDTRGTRAPASAPAWPRLTALAKPCRMLEVAPALPPRLDSARQHRLCGYPSSTLRPHAGVEASWLLSGSGGHRIATVPVGAGRISVSTVAGAWTNGLLLEGDNARALVATLDLRGGDAVWFVADESRTALLRVLWNAAWPAFVFAALALALGLWRAAPRFGARIAPAPLARRSMVEQIGGTASFIAQHGGIALHRAALRALESTARQRVPGYAALLSTSERAHAIAGAARIDVDALAEAMEPPRERTPRGLAGTLGVLEIARRGLCERRTPLPDPSNPRRNDP